MTEKNGELDEKALYKACEPMREDGMAISRYLEQLSGLLFLKACDSSGKVTLDKISGDDDELYLPEEYRWEAISDPGKENSLELYETAIEELKDDGVLARRAFDQFTPQFNREKTFKETVNRIEDISGWDDFDENSKGFGSAYEYLLEQYADKAEGAGEYFTPRPLIQAMVEIMDPDVDETIIDPAAGTNGFLIEAYNYMKEETNNFSDVVNTDVEAQFYSRELRTETYRLGLMNYLLNDMDPSSIHDMRGDSLREEKDSESEYDIVLANPPFGSNVQTKYNNKADSSIEMNFLLMMMDMLSDNGRAAIIVPEGILFDSSKKAAREELLNYFNLDCILTLPEDSFQPYAGVKANVLFFERNEEGTDEFWYYDARTDFENVKKSNPLSYDKHLSDFVENWNSREDSEYYFKVGTDEVDEDNYELHLKRYKEYKYEGHRPPAEIAQDIKNELDTIENTLDTLVGDNQ